MKTYSKDKLEIEANKVMDFNQTNKVVACKDGQIFLADRENAIKNHVREVFGIDAKVEDYTYEFERKSTEPMAEPSESETWAVKTIKAVKEDVIEMDSIEKLTEILGWVVSKGSKAAIEERIEALKAV